MEPVETSRRRPPVTGADALFQTYGDMVYRLAFLRTKSAADAEDVLQEVFVRCLRSNPAWADALAAYEAGQQAYYDAIGQ